MVEELIVFAISALFGLGCFGAIVAVILSPETLNVDKIFSIGAALLFGLTFLGFSAWMLFNTRLRELWKPAAAAPVPQESSAQKKPAAAEQVKE